eukprot:TRINITY_DN968_c0_g1_i1.p1 TRINITY_DN968_c0_g1~~TRINITY_DN968_c0_g1_i1.p1  ORF type:complete len:553 (+),score=207.80 TRINITY_DN968_c0_g1_i1:73-1731(+)
MRRALKVIGGGAACGCGYVLYKTQTDDGFARAVKVYSVGIPVVVRYRWCEKKLQWSGASPEEARAAWHELDEKHAASVVQCIRELKGMYVKYGQMSAGLTNTFSSTWIKHLRTLEDAVPAQPASVVMRTIVEETGHADPMSTLFKSFDAEPLGSASIGQVHRATLLDGREVAVKVQYPDIRTLFRSDMRTIRDFLRLAAPEQLCIIDELERQMEWEFDYRHEAASLAKVRSSMQAAGLGREVIVPKPYAEMTTQRALFMEFLPGPKLADAVREYAGVVAEREGKTLEEFETEIRTKWEREGYPERYEGPSAFKLSVYIGALKVRNAAANLAVAVWNTTLGLLFGKLERFDTLLPPNAPRLMDTLMRVHGRQLFVDGIFNGDPHGGNFILLPDSRIGLIDYGNTKYLTYGERIAACFMYAALWREDLDMLMRMCKVSGYVSKNQDPEVIWRMTRFGYDSFGKDVTGGKNVQQFIDEMYARDPWQEVPDNLFMAEMMSFRLRTVGFQLNHPVSCVKWWGQLADDVLKKEGLPYEDWTEEMMRDVFEKDLRIVQA